MKQESQPPGVLVAGTERETADRVEKATGGLVDAVKFVSDQMNDVTVQIEEFNRKLEDSRRGVVGRQQMDDGMFDHITKGMADLQITKQSEVSGAQHEHH